MAFHHEYYSIMLNEQLPRKMVNYINEDTTKYQQYFILNDKIIPLTSSIKGPNYL